MYPIKFNNIYFDKVWGGQSLKKMRDNLPQGNVGESWDIACHKNGTSIVANGEFKGLSLKNLIDLKGSEILGTQISKERFPLLIKIISTDEKLSIQVHPDDGYSKKFEGDLGKNEAWYVIDAKEGAFLTIGLKDKCTREEFIDLINSGEIEGFLNRIPVKNGDVFFIKSGLIHAIGEGLTIEEIQQNSDATYRIYDYNRGRELQLKKGLDVIKLDLKPKKCTGLSAQKDTYKKTYLCLDNSFALELYEIEDKIIESSDIERFYIFSCVDGSGQITSNNCTCSINKSDSILIPSTLGEYTITGKMKLLKAYVPNINKVENEILDEVKM